MPSQLPMLVLAKRFPLRLADQFVPSRQTSASGTLVMPAMIVVLLGACASAGSSSDASPSVDDASWLDGPAGQTDATPTPTIDAAMSVGGDASFGSAAYLDRCNMNTDCQTGLCQPDIGGSKFCSRTCTISGQCALEHACVGGVCRADDTGTPCQVATPETCKTGLCLGSGDGSGACTRDCNNATQCPAGYACTAAGGSTGKLCVDIEKACVDGNSCGSGLCLSVQGCTAFCTSAADCPARLPFLPAYTCAIAFGSASPICVPPSDILGPDPIGSFCPATGTHTCRSGACDTNATPAPMCTQSCTVTGGCGPGLGCFPLADGGDIFLVCNRAGTGDLGDVCTTAAQCHSGLCDATGLYCTRHCNDGMCPTGWTCQPVPGTTVSLCRQ